MTNPHIPDDQVRSRQRQITADLRALILDGGVGPGERLPTTNELTERYAAPRGTVTAALVDLEAEGLIDRRHGQGVFATGRHPVLVRAGHYPRPAAVGQPYPWLTEASSGRAGSAELLEVSERPATLPVAAAFGVERGTPVVARRLLLLLDGEPAELVWNYYPAEVARGTPLAEKRKIRGGSPRLLADLGFPLRNAVDRVGVRSATVEEFLTLKLPADIPVLRQFRVAYTDGRRPVEVTVMVKAGQLYEIEYDLPQDG